jgi:hypothetical protein
MTWRGYQRKIYSPEPLVPRSCRDSFTKSNPLLQNVWTTTYSAIGRWGARCRAWRRRTVDWPGGAWRRPAGRGWRRGGRDLGALEPGARTRFGIDRLGMLRGAWDLFFPSLWPVLIFLRREPGRSTTLDPLLAPPLTGRKSWTKYWTARPRFGESRTRWI